MTWFDQSANQTEAARDHCRPFVAVDFDFPSAHLRVWSGIGELIIGADTYTGVGALGGVSWPQEVDGLDAQRKTFTLAGADSNSGALFFIPSVLTESDAENCFERSIVEYLGWLNVETGQLVTTPEVTNWLFDNITRTDGRVPSISVNAERDTKLLDRATDLRWTHEHHQQFFPGDTGFKFTPASLLRTIVWGGTIVGGSGSTTGGSTNPDGPGGGGRPSPARRLA